MSWHNPLSQRRIHFFDDVNRFGVRLEEALDGIPAFILYPFALIVSSFPTITYHAHAPHADDSSLTPVINLPYCHSSTA
jgi:hypothetical protein